MRLIREAAAVGVIAALAWSQSASAFRLFGSRSAKTPSGHPPVAASPTTTMPLHPPTEDSRPTGQPSAHQDTPHDAAKHLGMHGAPPAHVGVKAGDTPGAARVELPAGLSSPQATAAAGKLSWRKLLNTALLLKRLDKKIKRQPDLAQQVTTVAKVAGDRPETALLEAGGVLETARKQVSDPGARRSVVSERIAQVPGRAFRLLPIGAGAAALAYGVSSAPAALAMGTATTAAGLTAVTPGMVVTYGTGASLLANAAALATPLGWAVGAALGVAILYSAIKLGSDGVKRVATIVPGHSPTHDLQRIGEMLGRTSQKEERRAQLHEGSAAARHAGRLALERAKVEEKVSRQMHRMRHGLVSRVLDGIVPGRRANNMTRWELPEGLPAPSPALAQ